MNTAVYTFEGITVTMPLYRAVRNKYNFSKATGVVNVALIIVVILYLGIGLLGYLKYGADVGDVLTLSLPNEPLYNSVLVMYSCVICVSYPVQMYVTLQLLCPRVEYYLHELNMNTCLVTFCDYLLRALLLLLLYQI
ncbi:unnamed protein product [Medioppia subpectinata]|uniref:Amino acid transporter transmembrane domain-containing protein n=1 Tax=Medioppia subpectinata TaxID=1979941 RepID=A0A7R9LKL9_9ACAR|nr:unnamed protein product [Medioppia subpectinata]CAG2119646.1 unnamed protein product [Medioppia subpectinata]